MQIENGELKIRGENVESKMRFQSLSAFEKKNITGSMEITSKFVKS